MFGLKKNKSSTVLDETLSDKSKKIVIGLSVLTLTIVLILSLEVYTSILKGSQTKKIQSGLQAEKRSKTIIMDMAKIGKESDKYEYEYIKSLETIMSSTEFQSFKNSISGIANKNKVVITSLNENKPEKLKEYNLQSINYEAISNYNNYVKFKRDISQTPFRINFEKETIIRETPTSSKIKVMGVIEAIVFEGKEKLFEEKKKFIQKMKLAEEKKLAREKRLKELKDKKN